MPEKWGAFFSGAGASCALGGFMNNGLTLLLFMFGIIVCAAGIYRACHGFTRHEVIEKKDET